MPRQIGLIVPAIASLFLLLVVTVLPAGPVRAEESCIGAPNSPPPQGRHWYYNVDRANGRKCWYLGPQGQKIRQVAPQAAPRARPPAKSLASMTAEAAADNVMPPAQVEQPPTQVEEPPAQIEEPPAQVEQPTTPAWPAVAAGDATQAGAFALRWVDAPDPASVFEPERIAMRAPAALDRITTGAINAEASDDAPVQASATAATAAEAAVTVTPMRILILVACALAVAGALLYEILRLTAARRRVHVDQGGVDGGASAPHERMPPRLGSTLAPPHSPRPSITRSDRMADREEPTLWLNLRAEGRRTAPANEPAV
jgi:hypothetical protein